MLLVLRASGDANMLHGSRYGSRYHGARFFNIYLIFVSAVGLPLLGIQTVVTVSYKYFFTTFIVIVRNITFVCYCNNKRKNLIPRTGSDFTV